MKTRRSSTEQLESIIGLKDSGLFQDALKALDASPRDLTSPLPAQVLRAELLERVGRRCEAEQILQRVVHSKSLLPNDRSVCDFVLARIRIEEGDFNAATAHLNKCINTARRMGDLERIGFGQLKLFTLLSDGIGTDATGPLLADLRSTALKCGNPTLLCAIHVYLAQVEALRGFVSNSQSHLRLAGRILEHSPNIWLESVVENIRLALAIIESQLEVAEAHANRGAKLAERTGGAAEYAVNQGNSGFLFYLLGRLSEATTCYERTLELAVPGSQNYSGTLDSLAQVKLAQGCLAECESLLKKIDNAVVTPRDRETYVYRHAQLTRAQLAIRKGDIESATALVDDVLQLAKRANDRLLEVSALIVSVNIEARRPGSDFVSAIEQIANGLLQIPAGTCGAFEKALGVSFAARGDVMAASEHFHRGERIFEALHNVQALSELRNEDGYGVVESKKTPTDRVAASSVLQSIVLILSQARHAELVARELVSLLWLTGAVNGVKAILRSKNQQERVLSEMRSPDSSNAEEGQRRITVGDTIDGVVELLVETKTDCESIVTAQAASHLIALATALRTTKDDQKGLTGIWQADEFRHSDGKSVISGQMREQMNLAQKVARTTVNVLITGESGTGKEILARAIHDFSDRARKAFVPLNCAAVPRELLESQLFGHRRGAFTGADRDHLGVIRSAAGGTLFLDEIGEMSLELQPKLLRFLESGEISPLGELSPLTVNVRVIAATNINLEDAVRDGRFREDLFYRLNVVRLPLGPLRERRDEIPGLVTHFVDAAAREYHKGHLDVAEETLERLLLYRWPGNVRQLHNEIRRMVALAEPNSTLQPDAISVDILRAMPHLRHPAANGVEIAVPLKDKLLPTLSRIEYEMIKAALHDNNGRLEPAAKALGISRKGLYLKRQRLGL